MSALFDEPVRAHYKDPDTDQWEPVLWVGLTSTDKLLIALADGSIETADQSWVTVDWRWTGSRWEDLQDAIAPQVDPPDET